MKISWPTIVEGDPKDRFQYLLHRGEEKGVTLYSG